LTQKNYLSSKHRRKNEFKMCVIEAASAGTETNRITAELAVCFETKVNEISVPGKGGEFLLSYANTKKEIFLTWKCQKHTKHF